jgi:membrane associated rhomboid family serine protease
MLFPIGDDQVQNGYKPFISYLLLALNIAVYIFEASLDEDQLNSFLFQYGAVPYEITNSQDLWALFTSMFLHGGIMHLLGNMVFLWVFADNIEAIIGSVRFLIFYCVGGLLAMAAQCFLDPSSQIPCVGASGAIAAVLGAYLVMFPKSRIKIWAVVFVFRWPAIVFLGIWIVQQLASGIMAFNSSTTGGSGGVAWWAHIGGFFAGIIAGFIFRREVTYHLASATEYRDEHTEYGTRP